MDPQLRASKIAEMVRFLLYSQGRKAPVKRKELLDKLLPGYSKRFPEIFQEANTQLQQVFGLQAMEISKGTVKCYVLINLLPTATVTRERREVEDMALLSVLLAVILLKGTAGELTEDQLWNFLHPLGIAAKSYNPQHGDVEKLINKEFVEQLYLERVKRPAGDSHDFLYKWGPRAEAEVDKEELLSLVSEIYGTDFSHWGNRVA